MPAAEVAGNPRTQWDDIEDMERPAAAPHMIPKAVDTPNLRSEGLGPNEYGQIPSRPDPSGLEGEGITSCTVTAMSPT